MDQCWKNLDERVEEEVLDKYKVENSNREAYRGRGSPFGWRRVRRSKKYRIMKLGEDCWARIFALFREYNVQRLQSKHEESTEGEVMKQQQRMKIMKALTKKIRSEERVDAENRWWLLSCWRQTVRKRGSTQDGKTPCRSGMSGYRK